MGEIELRMQRSLDIAMSNERDQCTAIFQRRENARVRQPVGCTENLRSRDAERYANSTDPTDRMHSVAFSDLSGWTQDVHSFDRVFPVE